MLKVIVGLGNPGEKFRNHRHNLGFNIIDMIASKYQSSYFVNKHDGALAKVNISNVNLILFKPLSYMNNSGLPLLKLINFYKISPVDVFIIYDDLDLKVGKIKIKRGGGDAGHNGIKSINSHIGNDKYTKVRVGIGRPMIENIANYVLSNFLKQEEKIINNAMIYISENLDKLIGNRYDKFLNLYHKNGCNLHYT